MIIGLICVKYLETIFTVKLTKSPDSASQVDHSSLLVGPVLYLITSVETASFCFKKIIP